MQVACRFGAPRNIRGTPAIHCWTAICASTTRRFFPRPDQEAFTALTHPWMNSSNLTLTTGRDGVTIEQARRGISILSVLKDYGCW